MKAKELEIGDIVLLKATKGAKNVISLNGYEKTINELREDMFDGVELTKDFLLGNGFHMDGSEFVYRDSDALVKLNGKVTGSIDYLSIVCGERCDYRTSGCIYVHQLQHALRACGLEELANRLTVVKHIY